MTAHRRSFVLSATTSLVLITAACGGRAALKSPRGGEEAVTTSAVSEATAPSTSASVTTPFECPVTIPSKRAFTPPAGYPATYPHNGHIWYGTEELWTALSPTGAAVLTKMPLWWSVNFPGGAQEQQPDVRVTWARLDGDAPVVGDGDHKVDGHVWTTNAYTPETGWLMMAGTYPRRTDGDRGIVDEGCWRVEATYKGATLTFVVTFPAATTDS